MTAMEKLVDIDVKVWFSSLDRLSWFFSADYLVWKLEKMEHFLLKILVGNYFMSSSEMAPWKYSLVKIKPDLRLPSKYPTHFKLHQSIINTQQIYTNIYSTNYIYLITLPTIREIQLHNFPWCLVTWNDLKRDCGWHEGSTLTSVTVSHLPPLRIGSCIFVLLFRLLWCNAFPTFCSTLL